MAVTGWGREKGVAAWLGKQGVTVRQFAAGLGHVPRVIFFGKPGTSVRDAWLT